MDQCDVIVVGAGNAALCAALAAHEAGAHVKVLERAPHAERGGNSRFTQAGFAFAYRSLADIQNLVPDMDPDAFVVPPYPPEDFARDIMVDSGNQADPALVGVLAGDGLDAMLWMKDHGVRWQVARSPLAMRGDGKYHVNPAGAFVDAAGVGEGLVGALFASAEALGVEFEYGTDVTDLIIDNNGTVVGVRALQSGATKAFHARRVILGSGGFAASPELRRRYLGEQWVDVKVRGTHHNTGGPLEAALRVGAALSVGMDRVHSTQVDALAPETGRIELASKTSRLSYMFAVVVNIAGERFFDEGAGLKEDTYSKVGRYLVGQPQARGWQIFDQKVLHLLEPRYGLVEPVVADTIGGLAEATGMDRATLERTISEFNGAAGAIVPPFDPGILDGRATAGLPINKTNWAQSIDQGPFVAYPVAAGLTFTFGGLLIDEDGRVLGADGSRVEGLFAVGEITGGVFFKKYPRGAGLTLGSVFGRRAGRQAAQEAVRFEEMSS